MNTRAAQTMRDKSENPKTDEPKKKERPGFPFPAGLIRI
jgi:hypothetical protein